MGETWCLLASIVPNTSFQKLRRTFLSSTRSILSESLRLSKIRETCLTLRLQSPLSVKRLSNLTDVAPVCLVAALGLVGGVEARVRFVHDFKKVFVKAWSLGVGGVSDFFEREVSPVQVDEGAPVRGRRRARRRRGQDAVELLQSVS